MSLDPLDRFTISEATRVLGLTVLRGNNSHSIPSFLKNKFHPSSPSSISSRLPPTLCYATLGTSVMTINPMDGSQEVANPFLQQPEPVI